MKRPATLPIGAVPFDVEWDASNRSRGDKDDYGETLYPQCLLFVNEEKCEDQAAIERTLLHEGSHGAFFVSGLDEIFDQIREKFGFNFEEVVCTVIENNLHPYICALVKLGYFKSPTRK